MSDKKSTSAPNQTHLLSGKEKSHGDTKVRIKVLRDDSERITSKDDAPENPHHHPPHNPPHLESNPPPVGESKAGNRSLTAAIAKGFLISILLVAGVHFFLANLSPSIDAKVDDFNTIATQTSKRTFNPPRSMINRPIDIDDIVSSLKKDTIWDIHKIHFLKKNWMQLDAKRQWEISGEKWFKEFKIALVQQLNLPIRDSLFNKEQIIARSTALTELQALLAAVSPPHSLSETVEHKEAPNVITATGDILNETHNNEIPDISVTKTSQELPSTQVSISIVPLINAEPQKPVLIYTEIKKQLPENDPTADTPVPVVSTPIEARDLAEVTVKEQINAGSDDHETPLAKTAQEPIKPNVEKSTIAESTQNPIVEQNEAYKPQTTDKSVQNTSPKVATSKMYNYVNGSIESLLNNRPQEKLTVAELNDLIIQLSHNYERGDFKGFSSLFASDPSQENYDALNQTKKQFKDWLSGTSDRQMFIKELNWAFNKNIAIGSGELSLTLISNNQPRIVTINKSIELIVRKDNQKVFITKFEQSGF